MADVKLTPQQQSAVKNRGGSLLVSAAAGSGKTKVLVERLFGYMAEESRNVDDFLIITYTKAAAAELRGKIAVELSRRVAAQPDNHHLRRQLYRVYQADIKTVDAFCASLLRENAYLLPPVGGRNLTPDFRVLDEQEAKLLRQRVLDRVLEEFYKKMDAQRSHLVETLGVGRDDRALSELVLELYGKLQSHPYPLHWLSEVRHRWEHLPESIQETAYGHLLMDGAAHRALFWAERLEETVASLTEEKVVESYAETVLDGAAQLRAFAAAPTWDERFARVPVFGKLKAVRGESLEKELVKRLVKQCKDDLKKFAAAFTITSEEHLEDLSAMAPAMLALADLTTEFSDAYQREKVRLGALDFSDQEHYAVELLLDKEGKPTELAQQVSQRYCEIMVDEYQDTNEVQNCIFAAISRQGQNLFTVGDVKQSIYRFRLADPTIFLEKYLRFTDAENAVDGQERRIVLSRNFRSRSEVLEATNFIFHNIMSPDVGEMAYGEQEALYFGAAYYPEAEQREAEYHLISVEDTEEERFDRTAVEADFVAAQIETMLAEGYAVHSGDGTMRPCRADDFAILMRAPNARLNAFTAALTRRGIPCGVEEGEAFFETVEIAVAFAMLQLIDNPRQDVPLISVLRSPLYGFSADRLADIRMHRRDGDYYEALLLDQGEDTAAFLADLTMLRETAREEHADTVLWQMLHQCRFLAVFGAMPGGVARRQNLLSLYAYARTMSGAGKARLFDFVMHLRRLLETGQKPPLAGRATVGGVRLMSIHKSKGLEFPIVFLCDLSKRFNTMDLRPPVLVHPQLGLGCERVDRTRRIRYDTLSKTALSAKLQRESLSEEMRILYVALTRAQEKLIAVDCRRHLSTAIEKLSVSARLPVPPEAVGSATCLGDWLLQPLLSTAEGQKACFLAGVDCPVADAAGGGWRVKVWENPTAALREKVGDGSLSDLPQEETVPFDPAPLEAVYGHERATVIPTKVTATQLKGRMMDEELTDAAHHTRIRAAAFDIPQFLKPHVEITATERGTAVHTVMQYLDFSTEPNTAAVADAVEQLRQRKLLSDRQAEAVDCGLIARFLASPLCERIRRAETVYREYRFAVLVDAAIYDTAATGEEMVLQGVADCAFVENGKLIVVDFKTDRVHDEELQQRAESYRSQLNAYAHALEKILCLPVGEKIVYFFHKDSAISL
ncbi:MAG: helicase-exonuclease AddAB subunit AddA [Oscillospiraceae bacterium]|nr:helicase-exonuclease AddAB subunit AddA [Oscillospiraceae bacterium]